MKVISETRCEHKSRYIRFLLPMPGEIKLNFNKYLIFDETENCIKKNQIIEFNSSWYCISIDQIWS